MIRRHEFIAALLIAVALARDQRRRDRRGSQNASPCGSREMPSLSQRIASGNLCSRQMPVDRNAWEESRDVSSVYATVSGICGNGIA
jgi:hypothetical protein